ncbi:MAG: response regulator [Sedimentisphaerales bacterium]|nr:response regulator [Sedimentisphaerales bacterium]MBN2843220.1 response regulator [Sedimentisphaerales bacterium]
MSEGYKTTTDEKKLVILDQNSIAGNVKSYEPAFLEQLEGWNCYHAKNFHELFSMVKDAEVEAVVISPEDCTAMEGRMLKRQAEELLNNIGEGVCVNNRDGVILWANQKVNELSDSVKQSISSHSADAFRYFEKEVREISKKDVISGTQKKRRYSCQEEKTNHYYEMTVAPVIDQNGNLIQTSTVVIDATASRRLQMRINAIDKAGHELVRLEVSDFTSMNVEQRISLLENKIVKYAKELLNFDHFSIRLLNPKNNKLEVLFSEGIPGDHDHEIFASSENNGITGYVAATGRSYLCNNNASDPHFQPGIDGGQSSLTVPLRLHDKVIGTFNVESHHCHSLTEESRQMAEIFARYIAIAINILDLMVVERHQVTGQTADTLYVNISKPLNKIISDVSGLLEEYVGHDELRHKLQVIVDSAVEIKSAVKDVQSGPRGIFDIKGSENIKTEELWKKRVLVADDEEFIRETLANILGNQGSIVDTAENGADAITLVHHNNYDLVITDIKMPRASGYEVFLASRQKNKDCAVILMTGFGYDPNHSIVRANREGLNAVLYKPFKVEQLLTEIRQALLKK